MPRTEGNRPRFHFTPPQNWMNDPQLAGFLQQHWRRIVPHAR